MRKICTFFIIGVSVILHIFLPTKTKIYFFCYAKEETTTYAKASSLCTLYKSTTKSEDIDNVLFVIPETYFVTILEVISDDCMKVQYGNYVGFVDTSSVVIATFIPIVKILEGITCDIKDTSGTQIWSKPSANSQVLTTIPAGTKNIKYIAMAYGKIPSGGESNVWYYINYTPESNSTNVYEGYIYSENVTNLTEIVLNTESNPELIKNESNDEDYAIFISSPVRALIISLIAIPVIILVLIILYKLTKQIKSKTQKNIQSPIINNAQNFNYNQDFNNNPNFNSNYENGSYMQNNLRNEIHQMSEQPYIRKVSPYQYDNNQNYKIYPTYDSDDDML